MLLNTWPFGLAMFCGGISESINRFLKHGHNEHSNRGGGGCQVEGLDEVSRRKLSAIHTEAGVQAQCMTWLFAYLDVSWVVHGGPWSQVEDGAGPHARFPWTDSSASPTCPPIPSRI